MAAAEPGLAGVLSFRRGVLRIGAGDRHRAEALALLAGAAIGRHPFAYTLIREPDGGSSSAKAPPAG